MRRRDLIKPELNQGFKQLCSTNVPVTEELFGDDLHKQVKDISESHRVVGKIHRGRGYQSYGRSYRGYTGRGRPWRGNSSRGSRFQPYQYQQYASREKDQNREKVKKPKENKSA